MMGLKTVTYEEFLKFEPCWLEDEEKRKQLERYGKRKQRIWKHGKVKGGICEQMDHEPLQLLPYAGQVRPQERS